MRVVDISALAEMRQWCGTSPKYEGLYAVVASGAIPAAGETDSKWTSKGMFSRPDPAES